MARTQVQQSQISGSLVADIDGAYLPGSGLTLGENRSLVGDLNDLRKQVNRIIGVGAWTDALDGEQDLADIYAAIHTSGTGASLQGQLWVAEAAGLSGSLAVAGIADFAAAAYMASDLEVSGAFTLAGAADLNGSLNVAGVADFQSAMYAASDLEVSGAFVLAGAADLNGSLNVAGVADFQSAMYAASDLEVSGAFVLAGAADLNGSLNVAGVADFQSAVYAASDLEVSGTMTVAQLATLNNGLTVNNAAADFNAGITADEIKIDGDVAGHLYFVDPTTLEVQDSADLRFESATLFVSGAAEISNGLSVLAGGLTVAGDSMEVTGSFGVDGPATVRSLSVTGSAGITISGDVAKRLYIVDEDGSIKDEEKLWFDQTKLYVSGSAELQSNLEVKGGVITLSNGASIDSAATAGELKLDESRVVVTGDLQVNGDILADADESKAIFAAVGAGHDITLGGAGSRVVAAGDLKVGGDTIVASDDTDSIELLGSGDVKVYGELQVYGNIINDSANNKVMEFMTVSGVGDSVEITNNLNVAKDLFAVSGSFTGDVTVGGDLKVAGKMTWIDTENLKIKDSLIHLNATGSSVATPRGLVLHGDQAFDDLAFGAKPNSGEFVFAKEVSDADVDIGNGDVFGGAKLTSAWMSEVKLGLNEDALSGSLAVDGLNLKLSAGADLMLVANGETAISFIEPSEYSAFNAQFPGMSLVAAIVAAGGNFKQDSFKPGDKAIGASIDYSSVGALRAASYATEAAKKLAMDVYLNGVRLAYTDDYAIDGSGVLTLAMATMADDVLTVVIHNAA